MASSSKHGSCEHRHASAGNFGIPQLTKPNDAAATDAAYAL
jgi:hypothetical protein